MSDRRRRIHPIGILIKFIREIKQFIFPLIAFLLFTRNLNLTFFWQIIIFIGSVLLIILYEALAWYRFTYATSGEEIHIQSGVLMKKSRHIHKNRVHTISQSAGILHQLFGVLKLRIETAGGGTEPEVLLDAVSSEEAMRIRKLLDPKGTVSEHGDANQEERLNEAGGSASDRNAASPSYRLPTKDLLVASLTSASFGVVLAGITLVFSQFGEYLPETFYESAYHWVIEKGILIISSILLVIVIVAWVVSVCITLLQYARFNIVLDGDRFKIERGLLEKKEIRFTSQKIQAVRIIESPLLQMLGYVTLAAESAGGSDEKSGSILLVPLIKRGQAKKFLKDFLPEYLPSEHFHAAPKKALRRYIIRNIWFPVLLIIPAVYFIPSNWAWLTLLLVPLFGLYGFWCWQEAGWKTETAKCTLRYRAFSRYTIITHKKRIQAMQLGQSLFQRNSKLVNLQINILSSGARSFKIVHLDERNAFDAFAWFSRKKTSL